MNAANPSPSVDKLIPVTVLTGFLGAGKTTLLRRILTEYHGQRIAVIENEFGEENIDNDVLVQDSEEQIVQLSNGCVCCTVRGDLVRALNDLAMQHEAGALHFDRVIIETTGMANPGPVCQTFFMDDDVADTYRLDAVITVVDAKHGMSTLDHQEEAQRQVGFADRILISKKDLVNESDYEALRSRLMHINPRASIAPVHFGETDLNTLLDVSGFNIDDILTIDPEFLSEQDHDHDHDHDHGHDHHHHDHEDDEDGHECGPNCSHDHHHAHHDDAIGSFLFRSDRPFEPERLEDFLSGIVQVYGTDLLRYKGILYIKGIKRHMVFQGVHMLMGAEPGKAWQASEKPNTRMVFIGRKLPRDIFTQGLEQCLA
jgi:G3E family GTPase